MNSIQATRSGAETRFQENKTAFSNRLFRSFMFCSWLLLILFDCLFYSIQNIVYDSFAIDKLIVWKPIGPTRWLNIEQERIKYKKKHVMAWMDHRYRFAMITLNANIAMDLNSSGCCNWSLPTVCVLFLNCTSHSLALALYVYMNHYVEKCKLLCKCTKHQTLSIITGSQTTNLKKKKSICYPVSQFFTVQSR